MTRQLLFSSARVKPVRACVRVPPREREAFAGARVLCGSGRSWAKIKEGAEGQEMGRRGGGNRCPRSHRAPREAG